MIGDFRNSHEGNIRLLADTAARELRDGAPGLGVRNAFRLRSHWFAHGFYGMPGADRMRDICRSAFGDVDDGGAFVRGLRSACGIAIDGEMPGSLSDRRVFWATMSRFGDAVGVSMPSMPVASSGPVLRGH